MSLDQPTILFRVIEVAEAVMFRVTPTVDVIDELAELVRGRSSVPVDGEHFVDEFAVLLMTCLARAVVCRRNNLDARAALWGQLAGVLLFHVKAQLTRALHARANARPTA